MPGGRGYVVWFVLKGNTSARASTLLMAKKPLTPPVSNMIGWNNQLRRRLRLFLVRLATTLSTLMARTTFISRATLMATSTPPIVASSYDAEIYVKEGDSSPTEVLCPLTRHLLSRFRRPYEEPFKPGFRGEFSVYWRRKDCPAAGTGERYLGLVRIAGNVKEIENFELGAQIVERPLALVGGEREYAGHNLVLTRVNFTNCKFFKLFCEFEFLSRSHGGRVHLWEFVFLVRPWKEFQPRISFPPPFNDGVTHLKVDGGNNAPLTVPVIINNLRRRGRGPQSVVDWELVHEPFSLSNEAPAVLDSSENNGFDDDGRGVRRGSSVRLGWMPEENAERAEISLCPNETWSRFSSAVLKIYARNHYLLEPRLSISKRVVFFHEPSQPQFSTNGETRKVVDARSEREPDELWLSAEEGFDLQCVIEDPGFPPALLSGSASESRGLNVTSSPRRLRWSGFWKSEDAETNEDAKGVATLANEKMRNRRRDRLFRIPDSILFRCVVESERLNVTKSAEAKFSIARFRSLRVRMTPSIVAEFQSVNVSCLYDANPPPSAFRWRKRLPSGRVETLPTTRSHFILGESYTSRRNHFYEFLCSAENEITREEKTSSWAPLKISFKDGPDFIRCRRVDVRGKRKAAPSGSGGDVLNADGLDLEETEVVKIDEDYFSFASNDGGGEGGGSAEISHQVDCFSPLRIACRVKRYPLMRLDEFENYVVVSPALHFDAESVNVTVEAFVQRNDHRNSFSKFLIDVEPAQGSSACLEDLCFEGSLMIYAPHRDVMDEVADIWYQITSLKLRSPHLYRSDFDSNDSVSLRFGDRAEHSASVDDFHYEYVIVSILVLVTLAIFLIWLWWRSAQRQAVPRSRETEKWVTTVTPLSAPLPIQYHSSSFYTPLDSRADDRTSTEDVFAYKHASNELACEHKGGGEDLNLGERGNFRLSLRGGDSRGKGEARSSNALLDAVDVVLHSPQSHFESSNFDTLPCEFDDLADALVSAVGPIEREKAFPKRSLHSLNPAFTAAAAPAATPPPPPPPHHHHQAQQSCSRASDYLRIVNLPYVNLAPTASEIFLTASDIYVNLPRMSDFCRRERMGSAESGTESYAGSDGNGVGAGPAHNCSEGSNHGGMWSGRRRSDRSSSTDSGRDSVKSPSMWVGGWNSSRLPSLEDEDSIVVGGAAENTVFGSGVKDDALGAVNDEAGVTDDAEKGYCLLKPADDADDADDELNRERVGDEERASNCALTVDFEETDADNDLMRNDRDRDRVSP